jgi:hypothetical protein
VSAGLGRTSRQREPEAGISVLEAGQQQLCPSVQAVGPRYSEWLPRILDALLPACGSAVRALADDHDAIITDGRVFPSTFPRDVLVEEYGIDANNEGYANSIVEWTAKWAARRDVDDADLPDPAPELREWCHACVTEIGTGQAPEGMDLDGLRAGPLLSGGVRGLREDVRDARCRRSDGASAGLSWPADSSFL